MNIRFLGTGASDWPDTLRGEKEYRRFASVIVDNKLLIDPGPHIFGFAEDLGNADMFDDIETVILTHSHDDHLNIENVQRLCDAKKRIMYCERHAASLVKDIRNIAIREMLMYTPVEMCGYKVTAVPANHGTEIANEQALNYIIKKEEKCFFYGCDSAWIRRDAWYYMRNFKYDLMVLDGTLGDDYGDYRIFEHNNLRMVELISETIRNTGVLKPDGKIMISHLAYAVHGTHKETEKKLEKAGVGVAYDGMMINM